jgi:hypothetical protein
MGARERATAARTRGWAARDARLHTGCAGRAGGRALAGHGSRKTFKSSQNIGSIYSSPTAPMAPHTPTIDPAARRWENAAPARSPWLHEENGAAHGGPPAMDRLGRGLGALGARARGMAAHG